jgi:hypothetical protein
VSWIVEIGDQFKPEFFGFDEEVQTEILALARLLRNSGRIRDWFQEEGEINHAHESE